MSGRRLKPEHSLRAHARRWLGYVACVLGAISVAPGCVADATRRSQAAREEVGGVPRPAPIDLTTEVPWPLPYGDDPSWRQAASGSDFDHARLAQKESVDSLLTALAVGGSLGRTALEALAYARDRREALGRLCTFAVGPEPATLAMLLRSIYEAVANGPATEETVDPQADARCVTRLEQLSQNSELRPEDRDRARGAWALLKQR